MANTSQHMYFTHIFKKNIEAMFLTKETMDLDEGNLIVVGKLPLII
jgi:hypothetical protein